MRRRGTIRVSKSGWAFRDKLPHTHSDTVQSHNHCCFRCLPALFYLVYRSSFQAYVYRWGTIVLFRKLDAGHTFGYLAVVMYLIGMAWAPNPFIKFRSTSDSKRLNMITLHAFLNCSGLPNCCETHVLSQRKRWSSNLGCHSGAQTTKWIIISEAPAVKGRPRRPQQKTWVAHQSAMGGAVS